MNLYYRDAGADTECPGLSLVHKLKREHVYLTSFSKMRVDLAAQVSAYDYQFIVHVYTHPLLQVMSETVSKAIELTGGPEAQETAKFVSLVEYNIGRYLYT